MRWYRTKVQACPGRSLYLNIPAEIVREFEVVKGDKLLVGFDEENLRMIIVADPEEGGDE